MSGSCYKTAIPVIRPVRSLTWRLKTMGATVGICLTLLIYSSDEKVEYTENY